MIVVELFLVSCFFYVFIKFPVDDFLDFRLNPFTHDTLHLEQMLLIPHRIFHG